MKKIFLMGYIKKNFGDDLFIKTLVERFYMFQFYLRVTSNKYIDSLANLPNLNIMIDDNLNEKLYNSDVNSFDAYVYIGGSIFMETGYTYKHSEEFYNFIEKCKNNNKPFYYISCNYGPYKTEDYFDYSRRIFEKCTSVCFRDKASFNLFNDLSSVTYAPDYLFSYNTKPSDKIKNSIGISVIDLESRPNLIYKDNVYKSILCKNIKQYIKSGKAVYLYSFCKAEGDEKTIDYILNEFCNNPMIIPVRYDGIIEDFLEIYKKMEYFLCTRFHSMVLSSLVGHKIHVLSYSSKTNNVIEDLNLSLEVTNISDIDNNIQLNNSNFKTVDNNILSGIIKNSFNQENGIKSLI